MLTYPVTGLLGNKTYYYTVTPVGNGATVSNQVVVQTSVNTEVNKTVSNPIKLTKTLQGIVFNNLSAESEIIVFDSTGKKICSIHATSPEVLLPMIQKGLYLLQIQQVQSFHTYKIIY